MKHFTKVSDGIYFANDQIRSIGVKENSGKFQYFIYISQDLNFVSGEYETKELAWDALYQNNNPDDGVYF